MSVEDLGPLRDQDKIENNLDKMKKNYAEQKKKNLIFAAFKTFRRDYINSYILGCIGSISDMLSPFLVQKIIQFLQGE